MNQIGFNTTLLEAAIIVKIAKRARRDLAAARHHDKFTKYDVVMDVTAVHKNGNPLCLKELLETDHFNFAHDILGIRIHLNRDTGKLMDLFSPRFSDNTACT